MKCVHHPEREPVGTCVSCGNHVCEECKVVLEEKCYCNPCAEKMSSSKPESGSSTMNTSGFGKLASIPPEIKGWSWGGFLLNWIWGLGNSAYIALLSLIPYFGFVWIFVVGAKGNEWAWRSKKWDSVEHFKKTQRKWAWWGLGIWIALIVIVALLVIVASNSDDEEVGDLNPVTTPFVVPYDFTTYTKEGWISVS